jgi:tRNA(Ile)-lysidine synthase
MGLAPGSALVAVSGGPDSTVLLDLLARTRDTHGMSLVVGHVDHGIHPSSGQVAEEVEALAASYGLPFESTRLSLGGLAGETLARTRRYAWLEATRARVGAAVIFTGHHADDQIETVLMRVLKGSGPAGLAAMAPIRGRVVRPLLQFSRAELLRYLQEQGLKAWLDPANADPRHLRSWIRTDLLPMLHQRVPQLEANLERLAQQAAGNRAAWDKALDVLPGLDLQVEREGISVAASNLAGYDSRLAHAVILAVARRIECPLGPARLDRVLRLVHSGVSGSCVPLGAGWTAELAFGRLRFFPSRSHPPAESWLLQGEQGEGSWGNWRFRWEKTTAPEQQARGEMSAWFTLEPVTIRAWLPGEKLKPLGATGRRLVVRCFQEGRVPRSRRVSWPILAQSDDVIWIPGVCRSAARLPARGMEALRVDAEYA